MFSAKEGKHVNVHIDMTGLPKDEGPFFYHIHERSVPGNGNCEAVGLHFNPYNASPVCDEQKTMPTVKWATCWGNMVVSTQLALS